jgi:hypothetical protein
MAALAAEDTIEPHRHYAVTVPGRQRQQRLGVPGTGVDAVGASRQQRPHEFAHRPRLAPVTSARLPASSTGDLFHQNLFNAARRPARFLVASDRTPCSICFSQFILIDIHRAM